MNIASRLRHLERAAELARPVPKSPMAHPGDELTSLLCADRPSGIIIYNLIDWRDSKVANTPECRRTIERLSAVIQERIVRMRALGWPKDGLGDDPPEAHEAGPPDHLRSWYGPNADRAAKDPVQV